jgi:hypothetical protein
MDLKQGPAVRIFRWGLARLRLVSITCFPSQTSGLTLRSPHSQLSEQSLAALLAKSDGMRMPVSGGMRYAPKLSTRSKRKEIKETGNEED